LTGDKVDNIPGVPGVGVKTAGNLLKKLNNIDTILDNIDAIGNMKFRGAIRTKNLVRMHQDKIRMAKQLTVIRDDPSTPTQAHAITRHAIDPSKLEAFLDYIQLPAHKKSRWLNVTQ